MIEISAKCDQCGLDTFFGVRFERPPSVEDLRARIVDKLGPDGMFICPRCQSFVFVHAGDGPVADQARLHRIEQAQRIGRSTKGLRFAVGHPTGPRSSVWRVWMNHRRDDVYIAARGLASQLKVSLHPDFWYYGFTSHYVRGPSSLVPTGTDRKISHWERPSEFAPGWTRAFTIVVPASELVEPRSGYSGKEVIWIAPPELDGAIHFTVLLSKPGAARGRRGYPTEEGATDSTELMTRLDMATGEQVWILANPAPVSDDERAQITRAHEAFARIANTALTRLDDDDPDAMLRALAFADGPDGALFYDLAIASSGDN
jgi:hypothetical protein